MSAELDPHRWWILPVILVGSFLSFLDFFIVNIALPAMHDDLGARPSQLQFVVAGYGIGFAVSLITGGRLGDIFGRKKVFLVGIGGFTLASALCGLAVNPTMLIVSRVLQAMMAATLTPQVLAIIRVEFAQHERPFAIGLYGTSMGFASIVAQVLGGALVSINLFGWSWRSIFLSTSRSAGWRSALPRLRWSCGNHAVPRDPRSIWLVSASYRPRCFC